MVGMFDDLIPAKSSEPPSAPPGGMFDDLIPPPPTASPVTGTGLAKQAGYGLGEGLLSGLSSANDVMSGESLSRPIINAVGRAIGQPGLGDKMFPSVAASTKQALPDALNPDKNLPQNTGEHFVRTPAEFIGNPLSYAGGGGVLANVVRAGLAGVGSELAGQTTKGTALEMPARVGGALITGGPGAFRRAETKAPALTDIRAARDADYAAVQNMGVTIKPDALKTATTDIAKNLESTGLTADVAPRTVGVLEKLGSRTAPATITDVDNARKVLGNIAKGSTSPSSLERIEAVAARHAIEYIDDFLPKLKPGDLAAGANRLPEAVERLTSARANAAAASRAEALDRASYVAANNAAAANSGMNVENSLRQQLKAILNSPARSRGFSADELSTMQQIVRGERLRNAVRVAGNLMGGGGGLGAVVAAGAGHLALPGLGIATPLIGAALKKAGNAATNRAVNRLDEMVRMRSPLGQAMPPPIRAPFPWAPRAAVPLTEQRAR